MSSKIQKLRVRLEHHSRARGLYRSLRGFGWRVVDRVGLVPCIETQHLERFDPQFAEIQQLSATGEHPELIENIYEQGAQQQRERLARVAELCAQRHPGDIVEIGAWLGNQTVQFAQVARQYGGRVLVIDPWEPGTQNCEGWEYAVFMRNTEPYRDIIDVCRTSSLDSNAIARVQSRSLCFAYVDGLHTGTACLSDIRSVRHTTGIIAVDDVRWSNSVRMALQWGARELGRIPAHLPVCREGYLLSRTV